MSTIVSYKGSTLTTIKDAVKTLKTSGKYMEDDVTIADESVYITGGITQDNNGYLILDKLLEVSSLKYESGTFAPASNVATYSISFSKTYSSLPCYTCVSLASGQYDSTLNAGINVTYYNWESLFGAPIYPSTTGAQYGGVRYAYRGTNATTLTTGGVTISYSSNNTNSSSTSYPRYWVTESDMKAYTGSSSAYWQTGKVYKWFAVWAPQPKTNVQLSEVLINDNLTNVCFNSSGSIRKGDNYSAWHIPNNNYKYLSVTAPSNHASMVGFVNASISSLSHQTDASSYFCSGYSIQNAVTAGESKLFTIPSNCAYIIIFRYWTGDSVSYQPASGCFYPE